MKHDKFSQLLDFLRRLDKAKIAYDLRHSREDALMVEINVPGERWEVEFLENDEIEVERFRSNGHIYDDSVLEKLFKEYAADSPEPSPDQVRQNSEEFFQHVDLPARNAEGPTPAPSPPVHLSGRRIVVARPRAEIPVETDAPDAE